MANRFDLLVVREDDKGKSWWTKIGVAFENRNGEGYQLFFEALPMPDKTGQCKVVMKPPQDREDREVRR